mgnify:CR=1 FL=1
MTEQQFNMDSFETQFKAKQKKAPMNPGTLKWLTFLLTPLISSFLLAFNWRRLGKKSWMWWTILSTVLMLPLGIITLIGMVFADFYFGLPVSRSAGMMIGTAMTFIMLFCSFPFMIADQQEKALMQMRNEEVQNYPYRWLKPIMTWFLIAAITSSAIMWIGTWQTTEYSDGWIRIDMPFEWDSYDSFWTCEDYSDGCRVIMSSMLSEMRIVFQDGGWVEDYETNQEMADAMWEWLPETEYERVTRDVTIIQGHKAYWISYDDPYSTWHNIEIYIMDGDDILYITVEGASRRMVENNWDGVMEILETMDWTP